MKLYLVQHAESKRKDEDPSFYPQPQSIEEKAFRHGSTM